MLEVTQNPFTDPIKKIIDDLKSTKWKIPFILPLLHAVISLVLLFVLVILFLTLGFVSQVSNSFWKVLTGQGNKMSFSQPLTSFYYAISSAVFFIIFLPFFIVQSPFWFSGWLTSKIGFKPFIFLLILGMAGLYLFQFEPEIADAAVSKVTEYSLKIGAQFFSSDTLNIQVEQSSLINSTQ